MNRIKTYVRGLDGQLNGGIPEGHVVLIAGQPGTMKSSLAFYIMHRNALDSGLKGVHVSLEQGRESLLANMRGLAMVCDDKIGSKISILDLGFIRKKMTQFSKQTWLEVLKMYIENLKKNLDYDILVIDSLPVVEVMAKFQEPREELFRLFEWMRDLGITTFLIHEMNRDSERFSQHGEDFLADGIIHLELRRELNSVNLFLSVVKMRKTGHRRGYYPLIYDKSGFEIVID